VYVVLLREEARLSHKIRVANDNPNPNLECLYVGSTGSTPELRFHKHQDGYKASTLVRDYGVKLLPKFYAHLNPMDFDDATRIEMQLAKELRKKGYAVGGGH
jgi:hypothetical protein